MPVPLLGNTPLTCSFGTLPSPIVVPPIAGMPTYLGAISMAVSTHAAPIVNIATFGMCSAPTNPAVVAAKLLGSPTAPCVYVPGGPGWVPPNPAISHAVGATVPGASLCMCSWLGAISQTPLPLPISTTP